MDIVSHGLWSNLAFQVSRKKLFRRKDLFATILFGIAPDVISFGFNAFIDLTGLDNRIGIPAIYASWKAGMVIVPWYVYMLYSFSHSLIIWGALFIAVWIARRRPYYPLLAWGFHIFIDIPLHTEHFFPTPFLWPLSNFHINGIRWSKSMITIVSNWIFLALGYALLAAHRKKHQTL